MHVLDRYTEKYQTTHNVQLTKKKNSYIYFITMACAVLSLPSFLFSLIMHFQLELVSQELNTFEIHYISTSKYLIHLITDDIKKYCIFGTIVSLLNVKPSWEKVINYHSIHSYTHFLHATYVKCET